MVDKYVIMPNHIHLFIGIKTGGHRDPPLQSLMKFYLLSASLTATAQGKRHLNSH